MAIYVNLMTAENPLLETKMWTNSWTPTPSFASDVEDVPAKTEGCVARGPCRVAFVVPCLPHFRSAALNLEDLPSS